ncbi:WcbI family polysaccharide biosynthesis putative acetyltransferase [Maliponia aquimaris]|uniref:Polysaccharide biosynthesis enzyme WcbI domain-containing protein n=1 Tax=Maliponia aquimaris TaxID=1673631 RepID=A0A238KDX6_9RHOB|nr:WcbI family polysaccharide biosynthesis putative acetyltransferase [Maliponia aquimaris]SMX40999.1 hypothetical protein MAA8898_02327 [Maliponia aquimaris]
MKVLVVSNCNVNAHHAFLKHFFPAWDLRTAGITQAQQWLAEGHETFLDFLGELDLCLGLPAFFEDTAPDRFRPGATLIPVPGFVYMGTRPDCFWLPGVKSPLGGGILHSRIAVSAFCMGKSLKETAALFDGPHYDRLGYFEEHDRSLDTCRQVFGPHGVDVDGLFPRWWEAGDFMYTPNHPSGVVLYDILRQLLASRGMLDGLPQAELDDMRGRFDDPLERGILWPVYPEIAEHLKVANPISAWRSSLALEKGVTFQLEEMLARSFRTFAGCDDFRARAEQALGAENIPIYAGDAPADARIIRDL